MLEIVPLNQDHVADVAKLHVKKLYKGFLSSLGEKVGQYIYQAIAESDNAFGFVAVDKNKIIGFICCAENRGEFYKYALKKHFLGLSWAMLPKMLRLSNIKIAVGKLFHSSRKENDLPSAEILAIAIDEKSRGMGVGRKLIEHSREEFRRRGIGQIKVITAETQQAQGFYETLGFELVKQYKQRGIQFNVYIDKVF
jgi:ribosomal protein S18 acetylase RimI-like enzyme